ncbi:21323_t:CDS:2, partial [Racocetra persica]
IKQRSHSVYNNGKFTYFSLLNVAHIVSEFDIMMALRGMDLLIEEKLSEIRKIEFIEKAIVAKFHILGNSESENLDLDDAIRNIEVTLGFEQRHGIIIGHKTKAACQL